MSSKKSIHLIKNVEFITCPYCNENFLFLHWKHLKNHNKKLEDVRNEFPNNPTMTQKEYNRRLEISKIGSVASKKTLLEIKNIKCFYCNTEKEVPKNYPNKFVCDNCLSKGKEDIDRRKKEETKIKRINTNIEKYGEDYVNIQHKNSMKVQNKKFNGKVGFSNEEIKEKIESKNLKKYGSKNYMQSEKAMENYISPALRDGVREKISNSLKGRKSKFKDMTYKEIYGEKKSEDILKLKHDIIIKKFIPKLNLILKYLNLELIDKYINAYTKIKFKCSKCNNIFKQNWNKIQQGYMCPDCYPRNQGYSKYEKEITKFIKYLLEINMKKIICQICKKEILVKGFPSHMGRIHNLLSKEYYDKYLKKENEGICPECGKETNFIKTSKGYCIHCSRTCLQNSDKIKDKKKRTNIKNRGVEYPTQDKIVINKRKDNSVKKHGVEHHMLVKKIKEKIKNTNLERYKYENVFQNEEIKEKIKKTNIEKYGYENPNQNKDIREKIKNTNLKRFIPVLNKQLEYLNLELLDKEYIDAHYKHNWKCTKKIENEICGFEFIQIWNEIQQGYLCPKCYPRDQGFSKYEKEITKFIDFQNINSDIIENSRDIISPYELDIFIPSKNIAIEFNGLYWHSEEQGKNKNYHLNKTEECLKKNIQLIHIFEDEWIFKQEIVKSRLRQILGVNNSERIHARKCEIREISPKDKNEFLNNFHIQGEDRSNIKLGAFYENELISIMTFSKGNISKGSKNIDGIYELNRFCSNSNYHIPGISSKLLEFFKRNYSWKEIYSYADRRWSQGNLYYKIGFELYNITKPNYWYVKGLNRIHRFNLRKCSDEPKNIPEWVLRSKEGYHRIWDCGHYKFIMKK